MLLSLHTIRESVKRIQSINDQITEKTREEDLTVLKNRFYAPAYDLLLGLAEIEFTIYSRTNKDLYEDVMHIINLAKLSTNIDSFKRNLEDILYKFEDFNYNRYTTIDFKDIADNYHNACSCGNNYVLPFGYNLSDIIRKINAPKNRDITLFYPDCGDGTGLRVFNNAFENLKTYGNARKDYDLSNAKKSMHKVVKGVLRGSRIQNNAFDIMYIQPPVSYSFDERDYFQDKRTEKTYLADMFKYLRPGGVMIITMPFTRLYKDVCSMLSKNLKNIDVVKADPEEFDSIGLIHIIGQKEYNKFPREDEYAKLRILYNYNEIPNNVDFSLSNYELPNQGIYIELFKGSALDMEEIESIIESSSLMDKIWENQKVEKLDQNIKNPLLPFNIGQLGLVLTSGCLDGVVDEGDGNFHAIKGRVSKYTQEVEIEKGDGKIELTETTVNKVEINVLLPNGEYKVLA